MAIRDHHIKTDAHIALKTLHFGLPATLAASQTGKLFGAFSPGYRFQITSASLFCISETGLTSVDIQIAPSNGGTGVSVLSAQIDPSAGTEVAGSLATTVASTRTASGGETASQIQVLYASASGSPVTSGAFLTVQYRPWPLNGEIGN